jgi:hypothetical protein
MTIKMSVAVRNGRLDSIESVIGVSAILKLRTGAPPALITDADSGTIVATLNLPSDWMAAAAAGSKAKAGTWEDLLSDAAGTIGHFRIYATDGVTQHMQGTVTITGGGGDMTVANPVVEINQPITVTGFTLTDGNA